MSLDPCIICFKHCCAETIFCKQVPEICPLCNSTISEYILQPFRLPHPFAKAHECPATIVIRPSQGDFLNHYTIADDLHIGVVNSHGYIFEFDKPGIVKHDVLNWNNCLALRIVSEAWIEHWDLTLESICNDTKWSSKNYNEETLNCFNFVLEFLKALNYNKGQWTSKEGFCQNFAIPKIQDALKFVTLYRKLKDVDHFTSNTSINL